MLDIDTLNAISAEEKQMQKEGAYNTRIAIKGLTKEDLVY